ncbi:MAG: hypothetical protein Q8R48_05505, partial [Candidatus Omnitrophota bacterium]|nr:hypothetical protein [Candidatus Omnitrophota bacterium]
MMQGVSSWGTIGINRKKPFKVMVCAVTLLAFLFNIISYDLAWAVRTPSELTHVGPDRADSPGFVKELSIDSFKLPAYLGYVRNSDKGMSPTTEG